MKLAVISIDGTGELALVDGGPGEERLFLARAVKDRLGLAGDPRLLAGEDPLRHLLASGDAGMAMARALAAAVRAGGIDDIALSAQDVHFLPPIRQPGKILAAGRNYRRPGQPPGPTDQPGPPIFAKFPTTLVGHDAPVRYPAETRQLDYEAELAVIIGRPCQGITPAEAPSYIAGYTIFNDLTMSDVQRREIATGLMLFGKNADDTGPCGPWMVCRESLPDVSALGIGLRVNGVTRQQDTTASMLFDVASLVAYCSRMTLMPGDIIATGTPAGIAAQRPDPEPFFLRPGDVVEAWIDGIGVLRNRIRNGL